MTEPTDSAVIPAGAPSVSQQHGMFGAHGTGDTSGFGGLVRPIAAPTSTPRPLGGWFDAAVDTLAASLGGEDSFERILVDRDELTLYVARERLVEVAQTLRDDPSLRFELLESVSGVDYLEDPTGRRLHAVYHLLSLSYRRPIRLEVSVTVDDPHVPSLVGVYPTADWHERETYDFFGIIFDGHPALTRIMMPDDWPGHPQRKDYPLGGIPVEFKGGQVPPPDERRSYS